MRRIGIEEHCYVQYYVDYLRSRKDYPKWEMVEDEKTHRKVEKRWTSPDEFTIRADPEASDSGHLDLKLRLAEMDKAGIDMLNFSVRADLAKTVRFKMTHELDWFYIEDCLKLNSGKYKTINEILAVYF
jgi:hypothetical protein